MTDGPTGFPVAPITEDEMSKVHDILRRAADAIVGMSQLKVDVDALGAQVRQLTDDAERLRKANAGLEESLYQARQSRMALEERLRTAEDTRHTLQVERDRFAEEAEVAKANYERRGEALDAACKDRDDAQLKVMELEDQLKSLQTKWDKVRNAFGIPVDPAPPSMGSVVQEAPSDPAPAPAPAPTPTGITRRYIDRWEVGALWDADANGGSGGYYIEDQSGPLPF